MSDSIPEITKNLKNSDMIIKGDGKVYIKNHNSKPAMLLIHATWCSHCVRFKPTYIKLSKQLNSNGINFPCYAIESTELNNQKQLSDALKFRGFPSIKYIDQTGKVINDYNGPRNIDSLLKDICKVYHMCYK